MKKLGEKVDSEGIDYAMSCHEFKYIKSHVSIKTMRNKIYGTFNRKKGEKRKFNSKKLEENWPLMTQIFLLLKGHRVTFTKR